MHSNEWKGNGLIEDIFLLLVDIIKFYHIRFQDLTIFQVIIFIYVMNIKLYSIFNPSLKEICIIFSLKWENR